MMTTSSTSASARRSRPRRAWGCLLRAVLGLCLFLALALAAGWLWLQSRSGKDWVAGRLAAGLDGVGGQTVRITGLDGRLPLDVTVREVALSDAEGQWLTARHLRLRWSAHGWPRRLRLDVQEASAREIRIDRQPSWVARESRGDSASAADFAMPAILVRTAGVGRVVLGEALFGEIVEYRVQAALESDPRMEQISGAGEVVELGSGEAHLDVTAGYRPAEQDADLEATLVMGTNSITHRLLRADPAGRLAGEIKGTGPLHYWSGEASVSASSWGSIHATLEAGLRPLPYVNATGTVHATADRVQGFLPEAEFSLALDKRPEGYWVLNPVLRASSGKWTVDAGLGFDPATRAAEGSVAAWVEQLASWSEPLGMPVSGTGYLQANIIHSNGGHRLELVGSVQDFTSPYFTSDEATIRIKGAGTLDTLDVWRGEIDVAASSWGSVEAALNAGLRPRPYVNATGAVQVAEDRLRGFPSEADFNVTAGREDDGSWALDAVLANQRDGWGWESDLTLDPASKAVGGTVTARFEDLSPWTAPLGLPVDGKAAARMVLAHSNRVQSAELEVEARQVTSSHGDVGRVDAYVQLADVRDPGTLSVHLEALDVSRGQAHVDQLEVRLERDGIEWDFAATGEGTYGRPFGFDGDGRITLGEDEQVFRLDRMQVQYEGTKAETMSPLSVRRAAEEWSLPPAQVAFGRAVVSLEGRYDDADVNLSARVAGMPIRDLPVDAADGLPDASVDAALELMGDPASPVLTLAATFSDVVPEEFRLEELDRAVVSLDASVTGGVLSVRAETRSFPAGSVDFEAAMPLQFGLRPFVLAWSPERSVKARLDADLDLAFINRYGWLKDQEVRGRLQAGLLYDGPFHDAEAQGDFRIREGSYQDHRLGFALQDIAADFRVREGVVVMERCQGRDGAEGRLSATGRLALQPASRWPFEVDLRADRTRILRQDHLSATASARLRVTGDLQEVEVNGEVAVDSGEFLLDLLPPAPPPVLEATHVGRQTTPLPQAEAATEETTAGLVTRGELRLDLTGPFFVRGAGIDSSWRGSLRLQSAGEGWRLHGTLQPRRGSYEFFGKRFTLVDSRVHFDGSVPPMPVLDVTAEYERREILARLHISGRMDDPRLELESEPDLPTDEILARVMFGAEASGLTPLQAAQLGLAVASMARREEAGGGWDLAGRTRAALQVDELSLREDARDASQVELVAGRYVSDRLYLEFSQRIGSRESGLRAEYEINRHLSIETDAGAQMRPGIRINARVEY